MKYLKTFEEQTYNGAMANMYDNEPEFTPPEDDDYINIALDVSGSISHTAIKNIIQLTNFDDYSDTKVNFIQFTTEVNSFKVLDNVSDILNEKLYGNGGGTIIQSAVDYIVENGFEEYKTFIISDFYFDKPDYSQLKDYELINVEDDIVGSYNL